MTSLLELVRDHAAAYADADGLAPTPIAGLAVRSATAPSGIRHAMSNPLVCLVVQGAKQVTAGADTLSFAAGDSLLISADMPIASQITRASRDAPYLSLVLDLDLNVVAELAAEMAGPGRPSGPVAVEPTDAEVADAALRLMRLVARPEAANVLAASLLRELHYWLLAGRHGPPSGAWGTRMAMRRGSRGRSRCSAPILRGRSGWSGWRRWRA